MKLQKYLFNQKQSSFFSKVLFAVSPLVIFYIQEKSMVPLLAPGDTILVSKLTAVSMGDIVVCKNPKRDSYRNYLVKKITDIKGEKIYVEGLNKNESVDSRTFGWIKRKNVIGKMISIL